VGELEENLIKITAIKDQATKLWTLKNILFKPGIEEGEQIKVLEFMLSLGLPYSTWQCLIHNVKSGSIVRSVALEEMASLARTLFEHVGVYLEASPRSKYKKVSFQAILKSFASESEWEAVELIAKDRHDKKLEKTAFRRKKKSVDLDQEE
jgi:hypothetical protein